MKPYFTRNRSLTLEGLKAIAESKYYSPTDMSPEAVASREEGERRARAEVQPLLDASRRMESPRDLGRTVGGHCSFGIGHRD